VEKLVYVLWRPAGGEASSFRDGLLDDLAPELLALGARGLSVLAADEFTEPVRRARLTRMEPPPDGLVSVWLDSVDDRGALEARLAPHSARRAGYLVTESVPRRNETHRAPPGERTPGITMLSLIEKPERLGDAEWLRLWHERHTPLANEVQATYLYIRNAVARPLTEDAPPWRGIVEEGFPTEAVTDPMLWYRAEGDPERLRVNRKRMIESVMRFLDVERVESHPMSEYVIRA
jgi:hypothetical protein